MESPSGTSSDAAVNQGHQLDVFCVSHPGRPYLLNIITVVHLEQHGQDFFCVPDPSPTNNTFIQSKEKIIK